MVERESTKHGRRLDEQLGHETASVVQGSPVPAQSRDARRQEDPGEVRDGAAVRPEVAAGGALGEDEAAARAELAGAVAPARFPAGRAELLGAAVDAGAGGAVLDELRALPEGASFENVQAIWEALGGHRDEEATLRERRAD